MDILFVCPFGLAPKYTTSGRALPLAHALACRGHHVRVLIPPWDHPADSGRRFVQDGVLVEHVELPVRIPGIAHAAIVWRMLRAVLRSHSHVIHIFKPKGYAGCVASVLWYLQRLGIIGARLVLDTDDWEGAGGWNERGGYNMLARRLFAWQERWGLTHCDAVTVASSTLQSLAWAHGVHSVRHVPNGLITLSTPISRELARSQLDLDKRSMVALVYTRFVEIGADHLAELLHGITERIPSLRVLVVGRGFRNELSRLQERLEVLIQGGCVRLEGWVEPGRLPLYWSAVDFALYASEDNLLTRAKSPLRLVEMMGAGLPIAAHGVGEVRFYLEDRISGLVVAPGDDQAFVNAAVRLAESGNLRTRLGENARTRIGKHFLWRDLAQTVEELYDAL